MANTSLKAAFERLWQHVVAALGTKADVSDLDKIPVKSSETKGFYIYSSDIANRGFYLSTTPRYNADGSENSSTWTEEDANLLSQWLNTSGVYFDGKEVNDEEEGIGSQFIAYDIGVSYTFLSKIDLVNTNASSGYLVLDILPEYVDTSKTTLLTDESFEARLAQDKDFVAFAPLSPRSGAVLLYNNQLKHGYGTAVGNGSVAVCGESTTIGNYSFAAGRGNTTGYGAAAFGFQSIAYGNHSMVAGTNCETGINAPNAFAQGHGSKAEGVASFAEGHLTKASGNYSHAEGDRSKALTKIAHAEGEATEASGISSHTEGKETKATSQAAHAEGYKSEANGAYSHAEGDSSHAHDIASHAEGATTNAHGIASHAEGSNTSTNGIGAHSEGINTQSLRDGSHTEGKDTIANGLYSHAEGHKTKTGGNILDAEGNIIEYQSGGYAHSEGNGTTAFGDASHAEGTNTQAIGSEAHAEGYATKAYRRAHAEGFQTIAETYTHAEGLNTLSRGNGAHAEGSSTQALATGSHSEGSGTIAASSNQHVQGRYNISDNANAYAHIVGNGTSDTARSNAHTLDWSGNAWYAGGVSASSINVASTAFNSAFQFKITYDDGTTQEIKVLGVEV